MLNFLQARETVIRTVGTSRREPSNETVPLEASLGRVLAEDISSDRDYPPFHRSTRDGFAVRAGDLESPPATLTLLGEVKAGDRFEGVVGSGDCVAIMTGAPVPEGADAVVMIEHTEPRQREVVINRSLQAGANIVPQGSEAKPGTVLLGKGTRIGYVEISLLGQVGRAMVPVHRRPRVAILSTGDEVVPVDNQPGPTQIRNSNSYSMGAQVTLSGGEPVLLGNAPDESGRLEKLICRGLGEDLLVLTGGVSMGKYDLVETVLRRLGADFHFDAVAIRPGRPAVFAACRDSFVFGLPGNPVSTMVTFELFVAPAIALLGGAPAPALPFFEARLIEPVKQKTQLSLFLPACAQREGAETLVRPVKWQGSGDVVALARSNCFVVVPEDVTELTAGSRVSIMLRCEAVMR